MNPFRAWHCLCLFFQSLFLGVNVRNGNTPGAVLCVAFAAYAFYHASKESA